MRASSFQGSNRIVATIFDTVDHDVWKAVVELGPRDGLQNERRPGGPSCELARDALEFRGVVAKRHGDIGRRGEGLGGGGSEGYCRVCPAHTVNRALTSSAVPMNSSDRVRAKCPVRRAWEPSPTAVERNGETGEPVDRAVAVAVLEAATGAHDNLLRPTNCVPMSASARIPWTKTSACETRESRSPSTL